MKETSRFFCQGDVSFERIYSEAIGATIERVDALPPGLSQAKAAPEGYVVAHSETGHHHVVNPADAIAYEGPGDPFTAYLRMEGTHADIVHLRVSPRPHETVRLLGEPGAVWKISRQREQRPEGLRAVAD